MNLNTLTLIQARNGLKNKQFSAKELTISCLKSIGKKDNKINAFLAVDPEKVLKATKKADKLIASDKNIFAKKSLLGIPFSLKDVYLTKELETTAGSRVLKGYAPQYNATVYQRLLDAGGILIGKTNCDAWGHGSSTENSDFGVTRNPWNLNYVPGGSSGGCAAAIASDMAFFSIGEDTGGSIRLPASFCSIVGLKVSYGRVSRYGSIAFASSLDTVGPMAKTVEDCALILKIIAGQDTHDATSSLEKVKDYPKLLKSLIKGIKIGIPKEFFAKGIDKEVKKTVLKAIKKLENNGAKIVNVSLPTLKYAVAVYYLLASSETSSNLGRYDGIRFGNKRASFGDEAKRRIMLGTYALSAGYYDQFYLKAQKARTKVVQDYQRVFEKCDCMIAPVSPTPAFKIGEKINDPLTMYLSDIYTITVNPAGVPSLAVPCGFSKKGLPIGMQIIGPQFSEEILFKVGHAYQQITDWNKRKPPELSSWKEQSD